MSTPSTSPDFEPYQALLDAGRLAVYRWVAPLAVGRTVLDVGCGPGDGTALLAKAAGGEIETAIVEPAVGVGVEDALAGVAPDSGDRSRLPHADGAFELVVAIGAVPGDARGTTMLDELLRVTAQGGWLVISAPDSESYKALRDRLLLHFGQVITARRHIVLGTGIAVRHQAREGSAPVFHQRILNQSGGATGEEVFLVAGPPGTVDLPPLITLEDSSGARQWIESWRARRTVVDALRSRVHELEQRLSERDQLRARLLAAQQALGTRIATHDEAVGEAVAEASAMFEATLGWKVTAPLRRAGALATRRLRGNWPWNRPVANGNREP